MAHQIHMKIIELTNTHNEKWNKETKEWKTQCEIQRVKSKQENEFTALRCKMDSTFNEYNIKKQEELEK
jgi:hypothetical protein